MKRAYLKPMMFVENFELSERIASECTIDTDPTLTESAVCKEVMTTGNLNFFKSQGLFGPKAGCENYPGVGTDINNDGKIDVCYHTSSGALATYAVFKS